MAQPSLADVHVDAALTDYSRAYFQNPGAFVWRNIAPIIPTGQKSNRYYVYDKDQALSTRAQKRAPNTESAVRNYTLSEDSYNADVWSIASDVSEQIAANADPALDPERDAARLCVDDINLAMEVEMAATLFTTGVWGTDNTSLNWADSASDPLGDIATAQKTILEATGKMPNTFLMGADVWFDALMNHPDLLSRLPDNQARIMSEGAFSMMIGGMRVLVAKSIRNTAQEGLTGVYDFNLGANALIAYVDPAPGLRSATAAATFSWSGLTGATGGIRAKRFEMPWKDAMPRVECDIAVDFKVIGSDLGYYMSGLTS